MRACVCVCVCVCSRVRALSHSPTRLLAMRVLVCSRFVPSFARAVLCTCVCVWVCGATHTNARRSPPAFDPLSLHMTSLPAQRPNHSHRLSRHNAVPLDGLIRPVACLVGRLHARPSALAACAQVLQRAHQPPPSFLAVLYVLGGVARRRLAQGSNHRVHQAQEDGIYRIHDPARAQVRNSLVTPNDAVELHFFARVIRAFSFLDAAENTALHHVHV